jgi:hypothetical protein
MSKEAVKYKMQKTLSEIGRAGLHAISPDDFEYYACTFELINAFGNTEDIFHFPVMPNGIQVNRQSLVSVKRTGGGQLSQFSNSFVGRTISISGTFGRKFRLMLIDDGVNKLKDISQFDLKVKTGYGALKLLEKLIKKSQTLDDEYNLPRFLIFHNYTLNHNHIVEILNFGNSQSIENNMIWNYNIEMKMLADVTKWSGYDYGEKQLKNLLGMSSINNGINKIFEDISL